MQGDHAKPILKLQRMAQLIWLYMRLQKQSVNRTFTYFRYNKHATAHNYEIVLKKL